MMLERGRVLARMIVHNSDSNRQRISDSAGLDCDATKHKAAHRQRDSEQENEEDDSDSEESSNEWHINTRTKRQCKQINLGSGVG